MEKIVTSKATPKKKAARTESLSLRLEPKTKFLLDLLAREGDTSITKVVEKAIRDQADKKFNSYGGEYRFDWHGLWHTDDGVQKIKLLLQPELKQFLDFEEEELLDFISKHWQFFYSADYRFINDACVFVLWPEIETFQAHWEASKSKDVWSTGKMMADRIEKAGIKPPVWPPQPPQPSQERPVTHTEYISVNNDDEIPF